MTPCPLSGLRLRFGMNLAIVRGLRLRPGARAWSPPGVGQGTGACAAPCPLQPLTPRWTAIPCGGRVPSGVPCLPLPSRGIGQRPPAVPALPGRACGRRRSFRPCGAAISSAPCRACACEAGCRARAGMSCVRRRKGGATNPPLLIRFSPEGHTACQGLQRAAGCSVPFVPVGASFWACTLFLPRAGHMTSVRAASELPPLRAAISSAPCRACAFEAG